MKTVGQRLRWARERAGLSQDELFKSSGVSVTAIHRIESDEVKPRPSTATKLSKALGVRVAWLTVGEEPVSDAIAATTPTGAIDPNDPDTYLPGRVYEPKEGQAR